jgi:hypothetical protein
MSPIIKLCCVQIVSLYWMLLLLQEQQLPEPLAGAAVAVGRWDRARQDIFRQGANRRRRNYKNNPGSGPRSSCC